MANTDWSKLNKQQLGRYGEKYALLEFLSYGMDVYPSEVDDHGVDMIVKDKRGHFTEIQVKAIYRSNYVYLKNEYIEHNDKSKKNDYYVCLILFADNEAPKLYLIPTTAWNDTSTKLFSERGYEYGISISEKNKAQLEIYSFDNTINKYFM